MKWITLTEERGHLPFPGVAGGSLLLPGMTVLVDRDYVLAAIQESYDNFNLSLASDFFGLDFGFQAIEDAKQYAEEWYAIPRSQAKN